MSDPHQLPVYFTARIFFRRTFDDISRTGKFTYLNSKLSGSNRFCYT